MPRAKTFGLVLATGLTLFAAVGAGPASATVLCKANENPTCLTSNTWESPKTFQLELKTGTSAKFTTAVKEEEEGEYVISCSKSEAEFTVTAGTPMLGEIKGLKFEGCSDSCTVTVRNLPFKGKISTIFQPGDGLFMLEKREGANPAVEVSCDGLTCIFGSSEVGSLLERGEANKAVLFFSGGWPLELEEEKGEGGPCADAMKWSTAYTILSTAGIYVV